MTGLAAHLRLRRDPGFVLDLELTVQPGSTVALLGPNGAGKSTAVAALAGIVAIDAGRITLDGRVLDEPGSGTFVPPEDRRIGVVFQDRFLFPHLSVADNVAFGLRSRGVDRDEARTRAEAWLDRLGLPGLADRPPADLSGGQAQRVALARALVTDPDALLLDEPLAALDVSARADLRRLLAEHLGGFDGPRLLITHDPTEAFLLADEVHVVEEGALTQQGTPDEIRLRPRTPYAADLAGINLVRGTADGAVVVAGDHRLQIADDTHAGPVLATIHPTAVSVHADRPSGSPRNAWRTTVDRVERLGGRVRLLTGSPLPLTVEITASSADELGLVPGAAVWLAVKATEIRVRPDTEG
ncbi:MAG: ABC transporter ATP-binding protein [Acidimicrobiia bacterium]|nr:ABC transporter ATP-binding protein [Acidimicrobiia bacterium]